MEQEDPKFVAVKVDVSSVSERYDFKVVVISDATSTKGVVANILRKIRLKDESAHAYDLVARMEANGHNCVNGTAFNHVVFHEDDRPLVEYANHPKGAIRFMLQKKNKRNGKLIEDQGGDQDPTSSRQVAIDKLRRSLESLRKTTSNVTTNGRLESTSDVEGNKENNKMVHNVTTRRRSTECEQPNRNSNTNQYTSNLSNGYTEPRYYEEPNPRPLPAVGTWRQETKDEYYGFEDSGIDVQSAGKDDTNTTTTANSSRPVSSPTSSSRENGPTEGHQVDSSMEESNLERSRSLYSHSVPTIQHLGLQEHRSSLGDPDINRSCISLSEYKPKRSLPTLSISLEDLQQKKRSLSQILAEKVQDYIAAKESGRHVPAAMTPYMAAVDSRKSRDLDDTMSLASLEVANILDDASDISQDEDVDPEGYESSVSSTTEGSSDDESSDDRRRSNGGESTSSVPYSTDDLDIPQVELPPNPADPNYYQQHRERQDSFSEKHGAWNVVNKTSPSENCGVPITNGYRHCNGVTSTQSPKLRGSHIRMGTHANNYSSPSYMVQGRVENNYFAFTEEPLSLHTVIMTHDLVPVSLVKSSAPSYGVIVYRADFPGTPPYMQTSQTQHLATWRVTAVLEAVPETPAFTCGNILPGDVIVEVNGHSVLSTPVEDVRALLESKHKLHLVVARWRHKQAPVRKVWDC